VRAFFLGSGDILCCFGERPSAASTNAGCVLFCSKLEFREGIRAMSGDPALHKDQLHPSNFTNEQLDDIFEFMDSKSENVLRFEQFVTHFGADKRKKPGRDGKSDAAKDLQRTRARSFLEVHMECKDERGIEKNLQVPATITFEDLLEKLKSAFGRAVTITYEDSAKHKHTVINAKDLSKCWNALATSGEGQEGTVHLECMVVDFDPSTTAKKAAGGRPSLAERRKNAAKVRGDRGDMQGDRDPVENLDFRSRHKWIDDMMRLLGAPLENEPAAMQNKWDALIIECRQLDISGKSIVTVEAFRNALTRTEPRMTAEHVEWFVQDADKDSQDKNSQTSSV
jgi:Ca2+-binding EF-hand superfamily protein